MRAESTLHFLANTALVDHDCKVGILADLEQGPIPGMYALGLQYKYGEGGKQRTKVEAEFI